MYYVGPTLYYYNVFCQILWYGRMDNVYVLYTHEKRMALPFTFCKHINSSHGLQFVHSMMKELGKQAVF